MSILNDPQNLYYGQFSRSQTTRKFQIPFVLHICDSRKLFHNFVDFTVTLVTEKKTNILMIYCVYGKTNTYINDAASLKNQTCIQVHYIFEDIL